MEANADKTSDAQENQAGSTMNKGENIPVLKENKEEIAGTGEVPVPTLPGSVLDS